MQPSTFRLAIDAIVICTAVYLVGRSVTNLLEAGFTKLLNVVMPRPKDPPRD